MSWRTYVEPLKPGRALDLACGRGRDAQWLADRGWQVLAVDRDAAAIAGLRGVAGVDARVMDLEREPIGLLGAIVLALHLFWSGPLSSGSESPGSKLPPISSPADAERK